MWAAWLVSLFRAEGAGAGQRVVAGPGSAPGTPRGTPWREIPRPHHPWLCFAFGPAPSQLGWVLLALEEQPNLLFTPCGLWWFPLNPQTCLGGTARPHQPPWISSTAKPITAAVGSGGRNQGSGLAVAWSSSSFSLSSLPAPSHSLDIDQRETRLCPAAPDRWDLLSCCRAEMKAEPVLASLPPQFHFLCPPRWLWGGFQRCCGLWGLCGFCSVFGEQ